MDMDMEKLEGVCHEAAMWRVMKDIGGVSDRTLLDFLEDEEKNPRVSKLSDDILNEITNWRDDV